MRKSIVAYCVVGLLCLPVLFFNVKSSNDWGDDFAQYIHQAKNIVKGIPQAKTGYIYKEQDPMYGPRCYPSGFPLLLAPVYAMAGNSIYAFNIYMSVILFCFGLVMFYYFQKYFRSLIAGILVLIFVYNPGTLHFKTEIMSDIPFAFFLLLCIVLYRYLKPFNYGKALMMIVLSAFLISIRNIGVVFLFSILIDGVVGFYRTRKKNKMGRLNFGSLKFPVMIAFGGFGVYYIFNSLVFKTSGDSVFSYSDIFDFNQCIHTSQNHLNYYLLVFRNYFEPNDGYWNFVSVICGTMFCAFMIIGMIKKVSERIGFVDVLVFLYLGIILIYPYSSGGFRFLLPVIPFLLYYCVLGIKCLNINMGINHHIITIIIGIIILFSYKEQWRNIYQNRNAIVQGPQEKESEEAFDYIRKNIPMDEKIDFTKPRALALYTDHQSMCNLAKLPAADLNDDLLDNKVNYVLINSDIADDSLKAFVLNPEYGMKEVWKNGKFTLFKR